MQNFLRLGANIAAYIGTLTCLVAGIARIAGNPHLAGFESLTVFIGGMALMLFSALLKLESISIDNRK